MAKSIAESSLGTAPDTYLYKLARVGHTYATIASDDSLRLFDISLKASAKPISAGRSLTCLESHGNQFITAGRDGLIRSWDGRSSKPTLEIRDPKGNPVSSISCRDHFIAAGNESAKEGLGDVSVLLYDARKTSTPVRNYAESHTDTITQLAFHPNQSNILLSASTDGLVSFFDLNIEDEDDALQSVLNPRSAVHCAGFLTDNQVYVTTTDEHLTIHSLTGPDDASTLDFGDVREQLQCTYVVTLLNAINPVLVHGHNVDQRLSLVELDRSQSYAFGSTVHLPGAHGEEIVRDFLLLEQERKGMSCGEDGCVKVWELANP